jgi:hypothetical protein
MKPRIINTHLGPKAIKEEKITVILNNMPWEELLRKAEDVK